MQTQLNRHYQIPDLFKVWLCVKVSLNVCTQVQVQVLSEKSYLGESKKVTKESN